MTNQPIENEARTPPTSLPERFGAWLTWAVGKPLFWTLVVGTMVGSTLLHALTGELPKPPPVVSELGPLQLVDQDGKPLTEKTLEGRVWLMGFFYTRCPDVCGDLAQTMSHLQNRIRNAAREIQLLSISVDPEHDTPQALRDYAAKYDAAPWRWTFATGPIDGLEANLVQGYRKVEMKGRGRSVTNVRELILTQQLALVDRWGRIRGFYQATDENEQDLMLGEASLIANLERHRLRTAAPDPEPPKPAPTLDAPTGPE